MFNIWLSIRLWPTKWVTTWECFMTLMMNMVVQVGLVTELVLWAMDRPQMSGQPAAKMTSWHSIIPSFLAVPSIGVWMVSILLFFKLIIILIEYIFKQIVDATACGGTGPTTQAPTTTVTPTSVPCKDTWKTKNCIRRKKRGHCSRTRVKNNCKKTCGTC